MVADEAGASSRAFTAPSRDRRRRPASLEPALCSVEMALTGDQERALALLREGWSTAEVAERIGLPRPVVWGWQNELDEFRDTLEPARSDESGLFRGPFSRQDKIRIAVPVLVVLLTALFFYLGYWR